MKSEKYLNRIFKPMSPIQNKVKAYDRDMVNKAIKIAEQETEERMRAKAIKAHRACCPLNELQCIHRDRDDYTCTYDCRYVTSFIQKLTENEND